MASVVCEVHAWAVAGSIDDVMALVAEHAEYHEAERPGEPIEFRIRAWKEERPLDATA